MKHKILTSSLALMSFMAFAPNAQSETVTTKTYVQQKDLKNVNTINFSAFDMNGDGEYSMEEVGERLFKSFDQDGNGVIDNIEWSKKTVMTITPMEEQTFTFVDTDDDGLVEKTTYEYDVFFKASKLAKFDENYDGLSAEEFIGENFHKLDDDNNNMINLEEWKEAYIESTVFPNAEPERYNQ